MRSLVVFALAAVPLLLLASLARADDGGGGGCGGGADGGAAAQGDRAHAKALKVVSFFSILVCGALGCCLPVLGRRVPALLADGDVFFLVKAFAGGVILATGFTHILPDAFDKLGSECLSAGGPWKEFPFAGFGAMVGAIGTLVVDTVATGYFTRVHFKNSAAGAESAAESAAAVGDVEKQQQPAAVASAAPQQNVHDGDDHDGIVQMHTHATHGHAHAHGSSAVGGAEGDKHEHALRHRVIAQVISWLDSFHSS
jgi:solute carrier family 39 (zinc transporter), member 1/2/3